MSPRFEWRAANYQSARADKTRYSFDRQFYPTAQTDFRAMNSHSPKGSSWSNMSEKEKRAGKSFKHVDTATSLSDLTSVVWAFSLRLMTCSLETERRKLYELARRWLKHWTWGGEATSSKLGLGSDLIQYSLLVLRVLVDSESSR